LPSGHDIFEREAAMNRVQLVVLSVVVVLGLLQAPLFAQKTEGTIEGVVTDPVGAVVPNVPVTITNNGTGQSRSVSTDAGGF
jgi:hypothetical protein